MTSGDRHVDLSQPRQPAWTGPRAWLPWLATLTSPGMLGYVVATIRYPFDPGRPIGWLQRVMVLEHVASLLAVAWFGGWPQG